MRRNNYNDPRLDMFRHSGPSQPRASSGSIPKPSALWGTGDSDMVKYAPLLQPHLPGQQPDAIGFSRRSSAAEPLEPIQRIILLVAAGCDSRNQQ